MTRSSLRKRQGEEMDTSSPSEKHSKENRDVSSKESEKGRSESPEVSEQPSEIEFIKNVADDPRSRSDLPDSLKWKAEALANSKKRLIKQIHLNVSQMEPPNNPCEGIQVPPEALQFKESSQKRRENCDVILAAGSKKVPCHQSLLIAYSTYFAEMFSKESKKPEPGQLYRQNVDLPDPSVLPLMVECLYNGCENLGPTDAKALLGAATALEINSLTAKCISILRNNLNAENYLPLKLDAIANGNDTWIQILDYDMRNHLDGIFKSSAFAELPIEKMVPLILNLWYPSETVHNICEIWLSYNNRHQKTTVVIQVEAVKLNRNRNCGIFRRKPSGVHLEASDRYVPGWVFLSSLITPKGASDATKPLKLNTRGEKIKVKLVDHESPSDGKRKKREREREGDGKGESGLLGKRKARASSSDPATPSKVAKTEVVEKTFASVEVQTDPMPELMVKKEPLPVERKDPPVVPPASNYSMPPANTSNHTSTAPAPAPAATGGDEDWDDGVVYLGVTQTAPPPPAAESNDRFRGGRGGFGGGGQRGGGGRFGGDRDNNGGGSGRYGGDNDSGSGGYGRGGGRFGDRGGGRGGGDGNNDSRGGYGGGGGGGGYGGGGGGGGGYGGGGGGGGRFGDRGGGRNGGDNGDGGGSGRFGGGGGGDGDGNRGFGGGGRFNDDRNGGGRFGGNRGGRNFGGGYQKDGNNSNPSSDPAPVAPTDEDWDDGGGTTSTPAPSTAPAPPSNDYNSTPSSNGDSNSNSFGGRGGRGGGFGGGRYGNRNNDSGGGGGGSSHDENNSGSGGDSFGGGGRGGYGRGGGRFGGGSRDSYGGGNRYGDSNGGGGDNNDSSGGGDNGSGGGRFGGGRGGYGGRGGRGGGYGGYGGDNNQDNGGDGGSFGGGGRGGGRFFNDRGGRGGGRGGRRDFNKPEEPANDTPSAPVEEDWD